jgi:DNA invertase Pin-like site-specific DNA recombinase
VNPSAIQPGHLNRIAVVYVRQSTPLQVEHHPESRYRQYQLADRARCFGWPAQRCLVIDDDLGISGAQSSNRPGYQRLVSMLALREVGIVFGLEVSRLARNCLDWYQLLELAAAFNVLIGDEDGLYDPSDFNDRLLLGLKGTFSEIERYQITARMQRGRLNKARRGEYAKPVPIGYAYDPVTGKLELSPDQAVRHAVEQIVHLFGQLGSMRSVLLCLNREGLQLPHQIHRRGLGTQIVWRRPSYEVVYQVLTNPIYAGVYCYGRRATRHDPLTHKRHVERRDRDQWEVFLPDHHPGYLSLEQWEANMVRLKNHLWTVPTSQGAPREGAALLQGLVWCQQCGARMRVRYSNRAAYYECDYAHRRFGEPICGWASARRVDALVENLVLGVIDAGTVDLAMAYDERQREEDARLDRQWQQQLQRLEYECELAQRRYELVDPANRLVAQTLESTWNERLADLEAARAEDRRRQRHVVPVSTPEQMRSVLAELRERWCGGGFDVQAKKELLRCVIEQVRLTTRGKVVRAEVVWQGGAHSELDVPKYVGAPTAAYHRVFELAKTHTDAEIAAVLNGEGLLTQKKKPWSARRVLDFRTSNAIPSGLTASPTMRLAEAEYITSSEAAKRLGVDQTGIQSWFHWGVLGGKQDAAQRQLWIKWNNDVERRLGGSAPIDKRMVSVKRLCAQEGKAAGEILRWASEHGHEILRVRRGTSFRFYIVPNDPNAEHRLSGQEGVVH